MNGYATVLIQLIKSYFHKTEAPVCDRWDAVFHLAKNHSLGNLFYDAVKDIPEVPSEVKMQAKNHFLSNVAQQMAQEYYATEIFSRLKADKISYMPMKGYILRNLYPKPEVRTSCDIDFFYDDTKKQDVEKHLTELGFEQKADSNNHGEWQKDEITVENHHALAENNDVYRAYYQDIWSRLKTTDGVEFSFTDEDYYIYLLVHAAKHFSHGGFGVRTVLDFYVYRTAKKLNEEYLKAEFAKIKLAKFAAEMEKLANVWFGDGAADKNTEFLSEYIFKSGTYGLTENNTLMNSVSKDGSANKAKRNFVWSTVFPRYKNMKTVYPVLKKCPVLLPFMWIYRWFDVLINRRKNIKTAMNKMKGIDDASVRVAQKAIEITEVPLD